MTTISISHLLQSSFLSDSSILQSLGEDFNLCDNGNMLFHWADFNETCDAIKGHMESNQQLMDDFRRREGTLARLKLIPVWIKTQSKVYQSTMHELYEKFLLNHSNLLGIDAFGPIEISFISGAGPFKAMAIAECFNNATYKDFVLVYLLQGKLPKRDYRIRLKSKVLMEYGLNFNKAHLVQLEQMTLSGLLFSMDAKLFNYEVANEPKIRFLLDTHVLHEADKKNLPDLKAHLSHYAFNLMYSSRKEDAIDCNLGDFTAQSSYDFFRNKKIYIFTPYSKLEASSSQSVSNIQNFVEYTRELVRSHYCQSVKAKSA